MKNTRLLVRILTGMFGRWVTVIDRAEYEQQEDEYQRKLAECEKMIQALQVDREEYEYLKHLADTLVRLEKRLHNTDNASEILKETFRTACEFYGADWAGFLEVDPETNVWWPFDWLSVKSGDMTKTYLDEFEPLSIVPRWVTAMELNQAIALQDREEIKDDYPEEYALYERVKLYSVLAVPVKPRPCGFLAVRNPTRYVYAAFADVLQLLAFVALVNINDIMQHRMRKLVRLSKDIRSANDIYIKLFGNFEFIADKGSITADDVERSSTVLFLSYLAIRHKEKLPSYLLDELLAEDGTAKRTVYNIVSQARKDLQPLQKPDLLPAAKNSSGYYFNPVYNIITDLDRFDELYNNIMEGGNTPRNYLNCVQMMEVYYADLSPGVGSEQDGFRPVVIVQNNLGNKHSSTTIAVAITSRKTKSNIPTHVVIEPTDAMVKSIILTEQIRTIDKSRLGRYLCTLTEEQMKKVDQALHISLDLKD